MRRDVKNSIIGFLSQNFPNLDIEEPSCLSNLGTWEQERLCAWLSHQYEIVLTNSDLKSTKDIESLTQLVQNRLESV